ncbi:hypothetical protein D1872_180450 [compost metagenome]
MRSLLSGRKPLIIAVVAYVLLTGFDMNIWVLICKYAFIIFSYVIAPLLIWGFMDIMPTPLLIASIWLHFLFIILSFIDIVSLMDTVNNLLVIIVLITLNIYIFFYVIIMSFKMFKHIHKYLDEQQGFKAASFAFLLVLLLLIFPDLYFSFCYDLLIILFELPNSLDESTKEAIRNLSKEHFDLFYYSFAIHFAISLDSQSVLSALHQVIQSNFYLQWQHLIHFTLNKLTELILITYTISLLIGYLNEKRKKIEDKGL